MNMMLAEIQASQWILLGVIVLLIICYPIFMILRNKKEQQKVSELNQSIKVGKDILTSSGVYGTVVDIRDGENGSKIVTIETGVDDKKSYLSIDSLAVYAVLNPDPVVEEKPEVKPEEEQPQAGDTAQEEKAEEAKTEEVETQPANVEEQPKEEKKAKNQKKSKK